MVQSMEHPWGAELRGNGDTIMVISFSSEKARNHLLDKGYVYTFRLNNRTMLGKDWANTGRGTKKFTDVTVIEIGSKSVDELWPWAKESGFVSMKGWVNEMTVLNWRLGGTKITYETHGWLYKVTLRNSPTEETKDV